MKVGDLVKLKPSVLHGSADLDMFDRWGKRPPEHLGVIVSRDQNAIKVHWFEEKGAIKPSKSQYVLKLIVVSEL